MSRLDSQARKLLELRATADLADREATSAKKALEDFELAFWSELEDLGLKSFTTSEGVRLERRETISHEMIDKQALLEWAEENDMAAEWFGPQPRRKALNEFVRTALENSIPLPPGLSRRSKKYIQIKK